MLSEIILSKKLADLSFAYAMSRRPAVSENVRKVQICISSVFMQCEFTAQIIKLFKPDLRTWGGQVAGDSQAQSEWDSLPTTITVVNGLSTSWWQPPDPALGGP